MITVTLPLVAPTGLSATLVAGGSLLPNTTYYYIVIAYNSIYYSAQELVFHSPISAESSFTTDTTNLSVLIKWSNVTNATRYQILLTTISEDYTNSGGYGTTLEGTGSITSGVTGYTVTALSTEIYIIHSIQQRNLLVGNIDKSLGILNVAFSGPQIHYFIDIINAIIAAGFSNYIYYDGYNFIIKGWFSCTSSTATDTGAIYIYTKRLTFIKGGIWNAGTLYTMQFGSWLSDIIGANYKQGCAIDIQHSRSPIRGNTASRLKIYGSTVTFNQSTRTELVENKNNGYYTGGSQAVLSFAVNEIKDNILGLDLRGISSHVKDLKISNQNNYSAYNHIRLKILSSSSWLPYSTVGNFYNCFWTVNDMLTMYSPSVSVIYFTNFYDCIFQLAIPNFAFYVASAEYYSNNYMDVNYTLAIKTIDINGINISNVNISVKNNLGNAITWIEHDTTIDKIITGNKLTSDRTTDINGEIDYYVNAYRVTLNPANTIRLANSTNLIFTYNYPFYITISKHGFETQIIKVNSFLAATRLSVVLKPSRLQIDQEQL